MGACCSCCHQCCRGCVKVFARSAISLFNLVDVLAAIICLAYGVYLMVQSGSGNEASTDSAMQWTYTLALALGAILLLCAVLSFCGVNFVTCRCSLALSAWLSLPVALLELVVMVVFLTEKSKVLDFISNHQEALELSDKNVETFENFYNAFIWGVLGLFVIEILRFFLSRQLKTQIDTDVAELRERLLEDSEAERRERARKEVVGKKYNELRGTYVQRHQGDANGKPSVEV